MPTVSQEKRPNEKIRIAADFAQVLIAGDSLVGGNIDVTSENILTDDDTTSTIIATFALSGTSVIATVQAGATGDTHKIRFSTGTTTLGLSYETEMNLVITDNPAAENPLISREAVKLHLGITDASDDALVDYLLLAASAYIRRRTGRDFTFLTYTETLQPMCDEDRTKLQLSHYPVRKIDRIQVIDSSGIEVWNTTTATDWEYVQEGYVWMNIDPYEFYPWPFKNIVTYRAGFPRIPEDLSLCCAQVVAVLYRNLGREGLTEERIGHYMYRMAGPKDMPKSLRRELNDTQIEGVITRYMKHDMYLVGA